MTTSKIYTTRHAKIDETLFPFTSSPSPITDAPLLLSTFEEVVVVSPQTAQPDPTNTPSTPISLSPQSSPFHLCSDLVQPIQ